MHELDARSNWSGSRMLAATRSRPALNLEDLEPRKCERDALDIGAYERKAPLGRSELFIAGREQRRILGRDLDGNAHVDRTHALPFDLDAHRSVLERERKPHELHLGCTGLDGNGATHARAPLVHSH